MMMYAVLMRDGFLQGTAWGFTPEYVHGDGRPDSPVIGLKKELHIEMIKYQKAMANCNYQSVLKIIW